MIYRIESVIDLVEDLASPVSCMQPAAFELSGHLLMKDVENFNALTEARCIEMIKAASVSEEDFKAICDLAVAAAT